MISSSSCQPSLNGRLFQPNSLGRTEIINALKLVSFCTPLSRFPASLIVPLPLQRLPCDHSFDQYKWSELVTLYRNHVIPKKQRIYNAQTSRGQKLTESQCAHAKAESNASSLKRKMDTTTGLPYDVCNKRIKLTSPVKVQSLSSPVKTTSHESESKRDEIPAEMPVESISTGNKRINLSSSSPAKVQSHLLSPVSSQTTDKETGASKTRITWPWLGALVDTCYNGKTDLSHSNHEDACACPSSYYFNLFLYE